MEHSLPARCLFSFSYCAPVRDRQPRGVTCHGDEMRHHFMFYFINLKYVKNAQKDKTNIKPIPSVTVNKMELGHWCQNKVPDFLQTIFNTMFTQGKFHVKHTWDRQGLRKILIYENAESHVIICICLWFAAPHECHIVIFTNRYDICVIIVYIVYEKTPYF